MEKAINIIKYLILSLCAIAILTLGVGIIVESLFSAISVIVFIMIIIITILGLVLINLELKRTDQ